MRNRGLSKVYLIAGIVIGLVVILVAVRIIAYNTNDDLTPGRAYDPPSDSQTVDPFPRPAPANQPDQTPNQP